MTYKWIDDAFTAFQTEAADIPVDSLTEMLLQFEHWAEENGYASELADARRRARSRKKLFDAADEMVNEGYEPDQVTVILQNHLGLDVEEPVTMVPVTVRGRLATMEGRVLLKG